VRVLLGIVVGLGVLTLASYIMPIAIAIVAAEAIFELIELGRRWLRGSL